MGDIVIRPQRDRTPLIEKAFCYLVGNMKSWAHISPRDAGTNNSLKSPLCEHSLVHKLLQTKDRLILPHILFCAFWERRASVLSRVLKAKSGINVSGTNDFRLFSVCFTSFTERCYILWSHIPSAFLVLWAERRCITFVLECFVTKLTFFDRRQRLSPEYDSLTCSKTGADRAESANPIDTGNVFLQRDNKWPKEQQAICVPKTKRDMHKFFWVWGDTRPGCPSSQVPEIVVTKVHMKSEVQDIKTAHFRQQNSRMHGIFAN